MTNALCPVSADCKVQQFREREYALCVRRLAATYVKATTYMLAGSWAGLGWQVPAGDGKVTTRQMLHRQ